jgi:VWFA-related protein
MNWPRHAATFLLSLSLLAVPGFAQQTVAQEAASATPAAASSLVLDVVVHDRAGHPVPGLTAQDFIVLDNKQPQKIVSFTAVGGHSVESVRRDPPAEIVLLVDEVNTRFDHVAYERDQIKQFALRSGGRLAHPVSLVFFTDTGSEVSTGATQDANLLLTAFDEHVSKLRTLRHSQGFYGAVDRYQLSLSTLRSLAAAESQRPGRKMVIWISPGWAYLSGPEVNLTRKQEAGLFATIVATSNELRKARITLYSIDPLGVADTGGLRINYYQEFLKPVTKPNDAQAANLSLQVLATQTGGQVLNASNDIVSQIQRAVADADAYYTLTLDPPPSDGPDQYHAIEVKVETPGLTARTRSGYYGQP